MERQACNRCLFLAVALLCHLPRSAAGAGLSVEHDGRSFTVKTARMAVTFQDGAIVELRSLKSSEVHADRSLNDWEMPRGIGHLTGDAAGAARLHSPWGTHKPRANVPVEKWYPHVHHPHAGSKLDFEQTDAGCRATWTGLTNGEKMFPEETLTIEVSVDPDGGELLFRASGSSPDKGVFGVQVPVANLHPDHRIHFPSFGGVMYDRACPEGLWTRGGAPFWEAPVVAAEGRKSTIGLWIEDPTFRPNFFFCNWSGKSFALALESLNLMPFEPYTKTESVWWRLDAFEGGWVDAMTPYREWYVKLFEKERGIRASVKWADKIRVIIDACHHSQPECYRIVASMLDPETVMFHEWNARAPVFDQDLPDWTPRKGYPERVAALKRMGFRTMAYVNSYCVNYNCPAFKRDGIREFGLARIYRGFWKYTRTPLTFANAKDGQLMYLDPLSEGWRKCHVDLMLTWKKGTGTDANYEDTAGACGDFGNGTVDGLAGAQGTVALFQQLLERNSSVPMASEYGPDAIAFAVRWPLRYQQVWGTDARRTAWMWRQRPISAYIHGPLQQPWIPTIRATSNFLRHVVVACSDALGGLAQISARPDDLRATRGALLHMKYRAQLFSSRQLRPVFRRERYPDDLACLYEDREGRVYKYSTNAMEQKMLGPDGSPLYLRVTGRTAVDTSLALPGWPAYTGKQVIGLNPSVRYALMPGPGDPTEIRVTSLPEQVRVGRYYETEKFVVLACLPAGEGAPMKGSIELYTNVPVTCVLLNDRIAATPKWQQTERRSESQVYEVDVPAYFVFCKKAAERPKLNEYLGDGRETAQYIGVASGLARGVEYKRQLMRTMKVPGCDQPLPFRFGNQGGDSEVTFDYLVEAPSKDASLEIYSIDKTRYGNATTGRVYINDRLVGEHDYGPKKNPAWKKGMPRSEEFSWPTRKYYRWRIPVGHMAGQPLLLTIATDGKANDNSDSRWWSRPRFVKDPEQKALSEEME